MLHSVLLHFDSGQRGGSLIELGVSLARRSAGRVRGLSLVDTRRLAALSSTSEAACYTRSELDRLEQADAEQHSVRSLLSAACLSAGLDFDVRRVRGNPLEVLPLESQFHDLVVTSFPGPNAREAEGVSLSATDLVDLLASGVQPLLVVRSPQQRLGRVLLVGDGTPSSARAVRHFAQQNLLPDAELRLLAVGSCEAKARSTLREMADYCRSRHLVFESGWLCGTTRRDLIPYADKWGAELVVLGVQPAGRVVRRLWGEPAESILRTTDLALYAAT
jgi:nucleotide-binding universal stress UspA family protein